jgi:hypothetical protein
MLEKNIRKLIYNLIKEDEFGRYFVSGLKAADAHEKGASDDLENKSYSTNVKKYDLKHFLSNEEIRVILNDFPEEDKISIIKNEDVKNFLYNLKKSLIGKSFFYIPEKKLDFSFFSKKEKAQYKDIFLTLYKAKEIKGGLKDFFKKTMEDLK